MNFFSIYIGTESTKGIILVGHSHIRLSVITTINQQQPPLHPTMEKGREGLGKGGGKGSFIECSGLRGHMVAGHSCYATWISFRR